MPRVVYFDGRFDVQRAFTGNRVWVMFGAGWMGIAAAGYANLINTVVATERLNLQQGAAFLQTWYPNGTPACPQGFFVNGSDAIPEVYRLGGVFVNPWTNSICSTITGLAILPPSAAMTYEAMVWGKRISEKKVCSQVYGAALLYNILVMVMGTMLTLLGSSEGLAAGLIESLAVPLAFFVTIITGLEAFRRSGPPLSAIMAHIASGAAMVGLSIFARFLADMERAQRCDIDGHNVSVADLINVPKGYGDPVTLAEALNDAATMHEFTIPALLPYMALLFMVACSFPGLLISVVGRRGQDQVASADGGKPLLVNDQEKRRNLPELSTNRATVNGGRSANVHTENSVNEEERVDRPWSHLCC